MLNCFLGLFGRNHILVVRGLAQAVAMTGSDLSSSSKPWKAQYKTSFVVYEEFHEQVKKNLNGMKLERVAMTSDPAGSRRRNLDHVFC